MLSAADNELLTRTGPGTPMGDYFRRYWLPVALSREVAAPDGPPLRVTVMQERLLLFRDTRGRVGLVEGRCPHRGADLFFGRNEDCGLRCVYHGWKFDVDGKCLETPNVPAKTAEHMNVSIKAYPVQEFGDMVWAYLGPDGPPAGVPELEVGLVPPAHRYVTKKLQQCNWAQSFEGALDTAHFSFLHMPAPSVKSNVNPLAQADEKRLAWMRNDPQPRFHFFDHEAGFMIGASRKADGNDLYWRSTQYMLPSHSTTPSTLPGETYFGYSWVPITDHECWIYTYGWNPVRPLTDEEVAKFKAGWGQMPEIGPDFVPLRNRGNDYLIDREDQKYRTFTGVRGVTEQDAMISESQGLIYDRTRETLTATDAGVVRFRRIILGEAKALQQGHEPAAPQHPQAYTRRSGGYMAPGDVPFEEAMRQRFGDAGGRATPEAQATAAAPMPAAPGRA
jgi:phthalate 4,5-dioxygenase